MDQTATQGHALGERGEQFLGKDNDKCFYVFCIDTPSAARAYYGSWRHLRAHQQLLVVDPAVYRAVPELRVIESVQLRAKSIFVKELLQVQRPITLAQPSSITNTHTHTHTHTSTHKHTHTHTHTHTGDGHEVGALLSRAALIRGQTRVCGESSQFKAHWLSDSHAGPLWNARRRRSKLALRRKGGVY
jgi:hypothetical protein